MSKRDDILDASMALFNQHGYHAVGVDLIRDVAQVSKMTLYKYFPTKEVLVEEVLKLRHEMFKESLSASVEQVADPEDKFREVFNWHIRWFASRQFHGCMFIKATGEFHETQEYLAVSRQHKEWVYEYVRSILEAMGMERPSEQASYIQIVLDGMIVNASIFQSFEHIDAAWDSIYRYLEIRNQPLEKPGTDAIVDNVFMGIAS